MSAADEFAKQIDIEFEANLEQLKIIIRKIALEALQRVVVKTPVDTGRARMNWYVQIGGAGTQVTTSVDKDGNVAVSRGGQAIAKYQEIDGFPKITIYNNLPYIGRLENGYSGQAPQGMVAVTVTELAAIT